MIDQAQRIIHSWKESGYEDFADGTFGNGGQNIYVSRAGVLQRIHRFDLNRDGYLDLVFVNSHDFDERPPVHVCKDPLAGGGIVELPAQGPYAAAVGDLNGDGYDDLVIANQHNGTHTDLTAYIYYGSPDGLSERYKVELPAPNSRGVAIGDFNGDGLPDLAFACDGKLRVFYQKENCFLPDRYTDLDIEVTHLAAADLDGDGCAELYVRVRNVRPVILWGGPDGLSLCRHKAVGGVDEMAGELVASTDGWMPFAEGWVPKIVRLAGIPHLFRAEGGQARLYPVSRQRSIGRPLCLDCEDAVSCSVGDVNGDGRDDIVVAVCSEPGRAESSWVYWGTDSGYGSARKTALPTVSARDVAVGDLDGDGFDDIMVCQGRTEVLYTTESLIFRGCPDGVVPEPLRFVTHDATAALIARTSDESNPQVIFINHTTGRVRSDVPVYIYYGGPNGFSAERREELPGWAAVDAVCCDFNDDGWPDILIANSHEQTPDADDGSYLYWGGPDGFAADRKLVIPTVRAHGTAVGDFRHTGYLDLAVVGFFNPEILIFRGGPNGFDLENPQRILMDEGLRHYVGVRKVDWAVDPRDCEMCEPRWPLAADFNNDGWLDLFVPQCCGPRSMILWGGPEGFSLERSTSLAAEGGICATAADLTGNGWLDLIVGGHQCLSKRWRHDSYLYIYWGGPQGFSDSRRTTLPSHTANSLAVADFNNDGIFDIFVTSYHSGRERDIDSYIYWGMPGGIYSETNLTRLPTHSACGCLAADFNEDGWIDLAVANHKIYGNHVGDSEVWWNGPEGFCKRRTTKLLTLGPHGIATVDPGNMVDRGPDEFYISSPFQLPEGAIVTLMRWDAEVQPKTRVRGQLRFAAREAELEQAPWQGPGGIDTWFENGQIWAKPCGELRWLQYRLALGAVGGGNTPRVTSVEVEYQFMEV